MLEFALTDDTRSLSACPIGSVPYPSHSVPHRSWGICVGRTLFESTVLTATSRSPRELDATTILTITAPE